MPNNRRSRLREILHHVQAQRVAPTIPSPSITIEDWAQNRLGGLENNYLGPGWEWANPTDMWRIPRQQPSQLLTIDRNAVAQWQRNDADIRRMVEDVDSGVAETRQAHQDLAHMSRQIGESTDRVDERIERALEDYRRIIEEASFPQFSTVGSNVIIGGPGRVMYRPEEYGVPVSQDELEENIQPSTTFFRKSRIMGQTVNEQQSKRYPRIVQKDDIIFMYINADWITERNYDLSNKEEVWEMFSIVYQRQEGKPADEKVKELFEKCYKI